MSLRVYNTLSRSKEEFRPIDPDLVRMYVCGPTVYGHAHIGHAKSYISFDVIRRYLIHTFGKDHLMYVMNITDVGHLVSDADEGEDKVELEARRANRSPYEIAATYEESFWEDMGRLNVMRPDRMPHATDFIRQQIEMVETLIERGVAYEANGSVYFDVGEYERRTPCEECIPYGGLSNRQTEDQASAGRLAENLEKRAPHDFALWKRADPEHFMQWYSPWGWGFPGWHLECSAMSKFYLGESFDIHGGGIDNQFPHHECEIAQSQAAWGRPFARYWMHNNLVTTSGKKMGKSLGNATNLKELLGQYDPLALRYFMIQSHYRSPIEFDTDAIEAAQTGLLRLRRTLERLVEAVGGSGEPTLSGGDDLPFMREFFSAMDDDFNTTTALAALSDGVSLVNRELSAPSRDTATLSAYVAAFRLADSILGLELFGGAARQNGSVTDDLLRLLVDLRNEARVRKDFATSDVIRDRLKELGVALEDSKEGTRWSILG